MPIVIGISYPDDGGLVCTGHKNYSGTTYSSYWGINTSDPQYRLHVNGTFGAGDTTVSSLTTNGNVTISENLIKKIAGYTRGTSPTSRKCSAYKYLDQNETYVGWMEYVAETDGQTSLGFYLVTPTSASNPADNWSGFNIFKPSGKTYGVHTMSFNVDSGQLSIPAATGTAPFSISSTTRVPNLNADTVDGKHASDFALSGDLSSYLPLTGGTITSTIHQALTIRTSNTGANNWVAIAFRKYINNTETAFGGIAMKSEGNNDNNNLFRYTGLGSNFYKVWDEGNDGSTSGLDADLLDSYHSYAFMRTFAMSSGDNYDTKPTQTVGSFVAANFNDLTSSDVTLDDIGLYTTLVSFGYDNRTIQFKGQGWNSTLKYRYVGGSSPYPLQAWKTIAFTDSDITGNAATATNATYAKYLMNRGSTTSGSEVVISDSGWSIGKT